MAHLKLAQSNCADVTTAHEHYYDAVMIYDHLTGEQSDPLGKELEMGQKNWRRRCQRRRPPPSFLISTAVQIVGKVGA